MTTCARPQSDRLLELGRRAATTRAYAGLAKLTPESFMDLPVTECAAFKAESSAYTTQIGQRAELCFTTSGTTGRPSVVPRTRTEVRANAAAVAARLEPMLGDAHIRIVSLVDHNRFAVGVLLEHVAHELGAGLCRGFPYGTGGLDAAGLASTMIQFRPTVVVATPGTIIDIEDHWRRIGVADEAVATTKFVLMLGATVSDGMRARVARSWCALACPFSYGSTEVGTLATGCRAGRLHVDTDRFVLELRDAAGGLHHLAIGGRGELVVTPLRSEALALLRFATGDSIEVVECVCDSADPAIRVAGRADDFVLGPAGPLGQEEIEGLVYALPAVQDYLLEIDANDRVRGVRLLLFPDAPTPDVESLQLALDANVRMVDDIPMSARAGALVKSWRRTRTIRRRWSPA